MLWDNNKVETKYILALNAHPKIGSQTLSKLDEGLEGNILEAWHRDRTFLSKRFGEKIANLVIEAREKYDPDQEAERLSRLDIGYLTIKDRSYPAFLKEVYNAPYILYFKGDVSALTKQSIAVVGSRKYSNYGKSVGYNLARKCAESGLVVVSGMALGIDAIAHKAALDGGGVTVGVLGCGLDQIYPVSNTELGREVVESGGLLVSEFPPGTPPLKQNFPLRNRIIAGLSYGTLVIEAAEQSGALITAFQALEYNREVFAVPGNIDSPMSAGTNMLIKQGARVVTDISDILEIMQIDSTAAEERSRQIIPESDEEKNILKILDQGEKLVDEIIAESGLNVIAFNTTVSMMEMKGLIDNLGGGRYKRRQ